MIITAVLMMDDRRVLILEVHVPDSQVQVHILNVQDTRTIQHIQDDLRCQGLLDIQLAHHYPKEATTTQISCERELESKTYEHEWKETCLV